MTFFYKSLALLSLALFFSACADQKSTEKAADSIAEIIKGDEDKTIAELTDDQKEKMAAALVEEVNLSETKKNIFLKMINEKLPKILGNQAVNTFIRNLAPKKREVALKSLGLNLFQMSKLVPQIDDMLDKPEEAPKILRYVLEDSFNKPLEKALAGLELTEVRALEQINSLGTLKAGVFVRVFRNFESDLFTALDRIADLREEELEALPDEGELMALIWQRLPEDRRDAYMTAFSAFSPALPDDELPTQE